MQSMSSAGKLKAMSGTGQQTLQQPQLPLQKPPGYRHSNGAPFRPPPPRKPANLPHTFRRTTTKKWRGKCCSWCRTFLCIFLVLLTTVSISAGGIFYLWFHPRLPKIHLTSIKVNKFHVSSTPDGPPVLDLDSWIGIEIKNPNQNLGLVYDGIRVSVTSSSEDSEDVIHVGEGRAGGFRQDKEEVRNLKVGVKVSKEIIADEESGGKVKKGLRSRKLVVKSELQSGIGWEGRGWATGTIPVTVMCGGMSLRQVQNSMPECRIKILNRFYIN